MNYIFRALLLVVSLKLALVSHILIEMGTKNNGATWAIAYWQSMMYFAIGCIILVIVHAAFFLFLSENKNPVK